MPKVLTKPSFSCKFSVGGKVVVHLVGFQIISGSFKVTDIKPKIEVDLLRRVNPHQFVL